MKTTKEDNGKQSSIRMSLYWVVGMAGALVLAICGSMVMRTIEGDPINFEGIAVLIGAIGGFMAPAFGFKAWQKGKEKEAKPEEGKEEPK